MYHKNSYIDNMLIEMFEERYDRDYLDEVEKCGIWYTLEEIKKECEDETITLADCFADFYYVIIENEIKFCNPDLFIDDCDELYEVKCYGGKK